MLDQFRKEARRHRVGYHPLIDEVLGTIVFLLPIEMLRLVATGPSKTPQT